MGLVLGRLHLKALTPLDMSESIVRNAVLKRLIAASVSAIQYGPDLGLVRASANAAADFLSSANSISFLLLTSKM